MATLRSYAIAVAHARAAGLKVQELYLLDRPDELTREVFGAFGDGDAVRLETDCGDQGMARNAATEASAGDYLAFLDGDDLWAESWLTRAHGFLNGSRDSVAHPEYNYFFEGQATVFRQIDQDAPDFSMDLLRLGNYWDALSYAHRDIHLRFPYAKRDMPNGWAFEDWHWNAMTIAAGIRHRIVPDTVLFKRRQAMSQTVKASGGKARHRRTALNDFGHAIYGDASA